MHEFYGSAEWQELAERARDRQHNECQRCKARGYYSPCEAVHHIMYVKQHPELALSIENLECLCRACHEEEHKNKKFMNIERW
jgi:5-methylcytosine-specific restriction endonuclease McrA